MSSPSFTSPVSPRGLTLSGGIRQTAVGSTVVADFLPGDSGVPNNPFVRHRVDWGDGVTEESEALPVGRPRTITHAYDRSGTFSIVVTLVNGNGETSLLGSDAVLPIRVAPHSERQQNPERWFGLALPAGSISEAQSAVETSYPIFGTTLSAPAAAGQDFIVVSSPPQPAEDCLVSISQPGKFVSQARVIVAEGNLLRLDRQLDYGYDPWLAAVECRREDLPRQFGRSFHRDPTWFFPRITDRDLVVASLSLLMATRPFERVHRPELGCRIHELPFEPNDAQTRMLSGRYLADAVAPETRAQVEVMGVDSDNDNGLTVKARGVLTSFSEEVFEADIPLTFSSLPSPQT